MRDTVKFDPSIPDRQVTGESSTTSAHTCSSASNTEYLDVQSFSSASSYMALPPSLKHGKRHIPLSALEPPGPSSRGTGCSHSQCRCEEESIMQNLCNKRNERLNKPCKNGFCYCFTSDSEDLRKGASTSAGQGQHRCNGVRKEYSYNLPTDTDCSEVVSSDQYFADKEKEKKKKRVSLPPDVLDSAEVTEDGAASCSHKDGQCSKEKCRGKHFQATNKFKEFHCSDSDAPLIHIIQEVKQNVVMSEIRINRSKLKKSKARSKSAGRADEGRKASVETSDKIINTDAPTIDNLRKLGEKSAYRPEGKDAGTNTNYGPKNYINHNQLLGKNNLTPSEDDDSRSDLSNARPRSHKAKGGRLLLKRIGPDVPYRPSVGPPRKPPRNFSSSSDCSSLASEKIKPKHGKKKSKTANDTNLSIGDQPTMPANYILPHDTDDSMNGKDNFKKVSNNSLNSIVSQKPEVTKDTFDKLSAKADAQADRLSLGSSEGGYSRPVVDSLNIPNESFDSGPSSRQEFTPTCPPYNEVVSPNTTDINDLLRMLPNVPTGPVIINEPLNKLNSGHSNHPNVEYAEINVVSAGDMPNPEQVGWAPPLIYNMLNSNTATQKFESQHPLAEPQHVGWQPPPKLQIDTVDGTPRTSENEDSHNLASNMEQKSTPVKPDIPKDEQTPKNLLREKVKNMPQPPSKPVRQSTTPKMPTVLEMSHSGDEKTVLSFHDIVSSSLKGNVLPGATGESAATAASKSATAHLDDKSSAAKLAPTSNDAPNINKDPISTTKTAASGSKDSKVAKTDASTVPKDVSSKAKDKTSLTTDSLIGSKESTSALKDPKTPAKSSTLPPKEQTPKEQNAPTKTSSSGKSFQKRALKHTKSFLESLGFSKKKEGKDDKKLSNKDAEPVSPKNVETVATQTSDNVVLQGRRLNFDYASDDTLERRSITPIVGEEGAITSKPAHHSDEGFDFNRTVQSPKPERSSQRKPFSPRNFLKTLQPGTEKPVQDESYKSYASEFSEDFSVAVQDLLGQARAKLESESLTTAPETVTNTLTDESVADCLISARVDIHPEPIYAEIREDLPHTSEMESHDRTKKDSQPNKENVVYAKVVKKGGSSSDEQHPLSPHRPAPVPPPNVQGSNSNQSITTKPGSSILDRSKLEKQVPAEGKESLDRGSASRNAVPPQANIQQAHTPQDKISSNRPKHSPPPVPSEPLKGPPLKAPKPPTPPNQSPSSSNRSMSPPSSRGAFSPHLDDFFVHGPLQEVDVGPFGGIRSPQNSSESSTGVVPVSSKTAHEYRDADHTQHDVSHRRRKRDTSNDDFRVPQTPVQEQSQTRKHPQGEYYHDIASDSFSENERVSSSPALPPRSARTSRPDSNSVQTTSRLPGNIRESSQDDIYHSRGPELNREQYYPPLPHLRTTPRSSPQGQSSPDQDNERELYASVQPGEMSGAGTQSFYSIQSDRFATPVGWPQSQPVTGQHADVRPGQVPRQSGQTVHFASDDHYRSHSLNPPQNNSAEEGMNNRPRQQSRNSYADGAPDGNQASQPIARFSNQDRKQPQGSHQLEEVEFGENATPIHQPRNPIYPRLGRREETVCSDEESQNISRQPVPVTSQNAEPVYENIYPRLRKDFADERRDDGNRTRPVSTAYVEHHGHPGQPQQTHQGFNSSPERRGNLGPENIQRGSDRTQRVVLSDGERNVRYGYRTPSNIRTIHRDDIVSNFHQNAHPSFENDFAVERNERIVFSDGERNPRYADRISNSGDYLHQQTDMRSPIQQGTNQPQNQIYPSLRDTQGNDRSVSQYPQPGPHGRTHQREDVTATPNRRYEEPSREDPGRTALSDGERNLRYGQRTSYSDDYPKSRISQNPGTDSDPIIRPRTNIPQEPIYENTKRTEGAVFSDGERTPRLVDRPYYDSRHPVSARGYQVFYPNIEHYEAATFPEGAYGGTQLGALGVAQQEPLPPPLPRRRRSADDGNSKFVQNKTPIRDLERNLGPPQIPIGTSFPPVHSNNQEHAQVTQHENILHENQPQPHVKFQPKPHKQNVSKNVDHAKDSQPEIRSQQPQKPQPHPNHPPNPSSQTQYPPKPVPHSELPPKPQPQPPLPPKPQQQKQPPKPQQQKQPPKPYTQSQQENLVKTPHSKQQSQDFDYNLLPSPPQNTIIASPPHNISIGNPPVIEYAFPSKNVEFQDRVDPVPSTSYAQALSQNIPQHALEPERPLTSSTPQPPTIVEPVPSTSFNNSNEKYTPPRARALSKTDLSQASDIFLENLHQKNVNVTRYSDPSDHSDRSDEEKRSSLNSPVAISQFYYYDSSTGNGESSNSSFIRDPNDSRRGGTSEDAEFEDPCCGENCPHLKPGGYDTVDFDNQSPETISFKSCRSEEDKDENMNNSTSKDLNLVVTDKPPINPYENFKHKIRSSFRKSKSLFKKKRSSLTMDRSTKSDNDTHSSKKEQIYVRDRNGESDFEVDYISAIELLNKSTKDGSMKRQLEQTVSLCRQFPEFEASPEMVEAERLLLYSALKEKSTCKSNDSISSYRSTPKDFISGRVWVTSFEIPIKPNIHHDSFFNYYYIGVFTNGQDIRSTQSAEMVDHAVFFADCDMLFDDLMSDFEISVDLYVLRLRKLSSPPVNHDNSPVKIRKSSLSDSQEEVVSRFRMHGNFLIRATDLGPFQVKTEGENISRRSEFYLVSNNIFTLPINLFPRNINLSNEVWVTANAVYRFKNFELSGFLNVREVNGKLDWNRRWCQIDALNLHFWNYPQDCSEVQPILTIDLASCISNPVKSATREICPKPKSFQLDIQVCSNDEGDDEAVNILLFSTESQDEYNYWVKGLNYVLDFIRAWKVQVQ